MSLKVFVFISLFISLMIFFLPQIDVFLLLCLVFMAPRKAPGLESAIQIKFIVIIITLLPMRNQPFKVNRITTRYLTDNITVTARY